ncbi:uncharacterized protein LOC113324100 [Papaver somniferum]|uniref:uncharacterized protein LOC113324100 n=1 Tax=Papaver somniferum TaxID=3469 RepID=UPI000E70437B|nr:uncharacterized protein LOC113324100 [Papaver somniferum]
MVKELTTTSGNWNEELIYLLFDQFTSVKILKIYINIYSKNKMIWTFTTHGDFTTKSFQTHLNSIAGGPYNLNDTTFPWKIFWAVKKLALKVHNFMWILLHNGIEVAHKVGRFVEGVPIECHFCNVADETADHLFLHCPFAQAILFASPLGLRLDNNEVTIETLVANWLLLKDDDYHFCLGSNLFWAISKARNTLVFERKQVYIDAVLQQGHYWFNLYYKENYDPMIQSHPQEHTTTPAHEMIRWSPPTEGTIKINIDAAIKNWRSSNAAVTRDHQGVLIGAETSISNYCIPLIAEANGFVLAVKLVNRMVFEKFVIESNSLTMIQILKGELTRFPWRIISILNELRTATSRFPQVEYNFMSRRANDTGHILAKFVVKHNVHELWTSSQPPSCISSALLADVV